MTGIFVDTSAWYALVDSDDADHGKAAAFFSANTTTLSTTNAIFSETVTLIRYRIGHDAALSFGRKMKELEPVLSQLESRKVPLVSTSYLWDFVSQQVRHRFGEDLAEKMHEAAKAGVETKQGQKAA